MQPRTFAAMAVAVLLLVTLNVSSSPTEASEAPLPYEGPQATDSPGNRITVLPDGSVQIQYAATFRRWDGEWRPQASMNRAAGEWPYLLEETTDSIRVTVGKDTFTQGKVANARYEFRSHEIKETILVTLIPPDNVLIVPFETTYKVRVAGTAIKLVNSAESVIWSTAPFAAWDSADAPQHWETAVSAISYGRGMLALTLDPKVIALARFPLYVDPTWTLNSGNNWGGSTFQDAVDDYGENTVKIGGLADNFNDNTNEAWTIETGTATFASGVMQLATSTTVRAGSSWSDQRVGFNMRFTAAGTAWGYFRYQDPNNHYFLEFIDGSPDSFSLKKKVGGSLSTIKTLTNVTINVGADNWPKVVAKGNAFEMWWNNALKWSGTDNSPPPSPLSGVIKFSTNAAATVHLDEIRLWNTVSGIMTTPVRDAGTSNVPIEARVGASVTAFNQVHVSIKSSANNVVWSQWTNLKSDMPSLVYYKIPDQNRQRYYQLRVTLTSGVDGTPVFWELTTNEGLPPAVTPTANTGSERWYPYVGGMVNAVNGNLWYAKGDLSIRGRGFSLDFVRSYNSLRGSELGPLGNGWTHGYNEKLIVNGDQTVTWNDGDGSQHSFTPKSTTGGYAPPRGVTSRLVKNADTTFTLWHTDGSKEDFTSAGRLSKITDRNGNRLTLTYDGSDRLTTIADDSGKSMTLGYDALNRISTMTESGLSRQMVFTYDGSANLVAVKDPLNFYENYTYAAGKMTAIIDPVGKRTAFIYDGSNRVTEIWLGLYQGEGVVWQFRDYAIAYSSTTTRTTTNARGFSTTVTLNSFGNPNRTTGPSIDYACCDNGGNSSVYVWDGEMNKITTTDGRGFSTVMDYDHRGHLLSTTDPGGNVSSATHSESNTATQYFSLVKSQTNFRGFTTAYAYDAKGNLIRVTNAKGNFSESGYDSLGFLNCSTDFRGARTWYEYNSARYLIKITNPLNHITLYGYDAAGRRTSVTSPLGFVTDTTYNANDWTTRVTTPLGFYTNFEYNKRGDRTKLTDPNGNSTTYTINVTNGRVQIIIEPGGNSTTNTFDLRGNLLSIRDAKNHVTRRSYDPYDRLASVLSPLNKLTLFRYDAAGNRIGRTDANGNSTTYLYDRLNRVFKIIYWTGQFVTYSFDKNGNPTSEVGFGHTLTMNYDELDRLTSAVMSYGGFSKSTSFSYDANGNRIGMQQGAETQTTYGYDAANWPTHVIEPEGRVTSFSYDEDSRRISTGYPNNIWTNQSYDKNDRIRTVHTNKTGNVVIESFIYTYDKNGNRLSATDVTGTTQYRYDRHNRLQKWVVPNGFTTTYTYDGVGNRISVQAGSSKTNYVYDLDDRLVRAEYNCPGTHCFIITYEHDGNGNVLAVKDEAGSTTRYEYDPENRLTKITHPLGQVCTFTYTASGQRTSGSEFPCTSVRYYGLDLSLGADLGVEPVIAEYDSGGSRQARYTQGPGIDEPLTMLRGGASYSYHRDALGSVQTITDASQGAVKTYQYDPWGLTSEFGTLTNPFKFTGREHHDDSDLYYYRARTYDSGTGRFLSKDSAGQVDGTNLYAYAGNNPVNRVDPTGMIATHSYRGLCMRVFYVSLIIASGGGAELLGDFYNLMGLELRVIGMSGLSGGWLSSMKGTSSLLFQSFLWRGSPHDSDLRMHRIVHRAFHQSVVNIPECFGPFPESGSAGGEIPMRLMIR
jgi:RHS repeat-associated protein